MQNVCRLICVLGIIGLVGCNKEPVSPFILNCETYLEEMLKSPATLSIVKKFELDWRGDEKVVQIEYDAQNSFGALLRDTFSCTYLAKERWWLEDSNAGRDFREIQEIDAATLAPYQIRTDGKTLGGDRKKQDDQIAIFSLSVMTNIYGKDRK